MTADDIVALTERMKALGVVRFECAGIVVVFAPEKPSIQHLMNQAPLTEEARKEREERTLFHSSPGG